MSSKDTPRRPREEAVESAQDLRVGGPGSSKVEGDNHHSHENVGTGNSGEGKQVTIEFDEYYDYIVWEQKFSELVADTYGRPFRYQQMGDMLGQNTYIEFEVLPAPRVSGEWETEYAPGQLSEWLNAWTQLQAEQPDERMSWLTMQAERDHWIDLEVITWDLNRKGLLPVGTYLMKVWW